MIRIGILLRVHSSKTSLHHFGDVFRSGSRTHSPFPNTLFGEQFAVRLKISFVQGTTVVYEQCSDSLDVFEPLQTFLYSDVT